MSEWVGEGERAKVSWVADIGLVSSRRSHTQSSSYKGPATTLVLCQGPLFVGQRSIG